MKGQQFIPIAAFMCKSLCLYKRTELQVSHTRCSVSCTFYRFSHENLSRQNDTGNHTYYPRMFTRMCLTVNFTYCPMGMGMFNDKNTAAINKYFSCLFVE